MSLDLFMPDIPSGHFLLRPRPSRSTQAVGFARVPKRSSTTAQDGAGQMRPPTATADDGVRGPYPLPDSYVTTGRDTSSGHAVVFEGFAELALSAASPRGRRDLGGIIIKCHRMKGKVEPGRISSSCFRPDSAH